MANEIKAKQNGSVALFGNDLQKGFGKHDARRYGVTVYQNLGTTVSAGN